MAAARRRTSIGAAAAVALCLFFSARLCASASATSNGPRIPFRLALSHRLFLNLNENDARAAVKAWSELVAGQSRMEVVGGPQVLESDEIVRAIANHLVDGFSITTPEYAKLERFVDPVIFLDDATAKNGIEYLLLVRQDSGIPDLAGLRGRSLLAFDHVSMTLAPAWLETTLAAASLEAADRFFGRAAKSTQVSQAVLPVFFGRADACLVTRRAFDTMCELNPQLRQRLRILAVSPPVVAALMGAHKDAPFEIKTNLRKALLELNQTPAGLQILTLFQSQRIVARDSAALRPSIELLEQYERLLARRAGGKR